MKKIKIMLLSLTLVAIVGGALAFKAKFDFDYCTTTSQNNSCTDDFEEPLPCFTDAPNTSFTIPVDEFVCYTLKNGIDCNAQECPDKGLTTID